MSEGQQPDEHRALVRSSAAEYLTFVAATGDGGGAVELRYEDENIWLTQKLMAELYGVSVQMVSKHLQTLFESGELQPESVIKRCLITAADGKNYSTQHYSLQAIVAVGFKIENERAVQFRKWAGLIVKDYTIQGWAMDAERLKTGHLFTDQYFARQLELVREIRASERPGKVSAEQAKLHAETQFERYRIVQDRLFKSDFDRFLEASGVSDKEAGQLAISTN